MHIVGEVGYLVDGTVVADHHAIETEVVAQDAFLDFLVGYTVGAMHGMVARHHHLTACQSNHCLVGQEYLFHQFFLICIATAAIAQEVLAASAHASAQVALLKSTAEGCAHHSREVGILAITLLQAVERRRAHYIHHGRKCQASTHASHGVGGLNGFLFCQFGVERAGESDLLRIDRSIACVHTCQHFLVEEGRDATGCVVDEPVLHGSHFVAYVVRISGILEGELREMPDAIGNNFATLGGV